MCFSPSVSFGAGIVLTVTGAAALYRSHSLQQKALAGIPLLFAVQQFTEGVVWMSLLSASWTSYRTAAVYAFLVFAQMIWPVYMPLCALLYERNRTRRAALGVTLSAGLALAVFTGISLSMYPPRAIAEAHHIRYETGFALAGKWYYGILYFIPAVMSLLLASQKALRILGCLLFVSYLFARIIFHMYVISVWCFFGALISMIILLFISGENKKQQA